MFYRVRRALMEIAGVSRNAIRPDTPTATLLSEHSRRAQWKTLSELTGVMLPPLERHRAEIWEKLREIMVDELVVEPDEITKDAQFVRDLRLG